MSDPLDVSGEFSVDDPFELLGFSRQFKLNSNDVVRAQARALARCHPDRHAEGVARELSMMQSAQINAAATVLADPLLRAEALISIGDPTGKAVPLSGIQLSELLERRESMEESVASSPAGVKDCPAGAKECQEWLQCEKQSTVDRLEVQFSAQSVDWVATRAAVAYLRAIVRLSNEWTRLRDGQRKENK